MKSSHSLVSGKESAIRRNRTDSAEPKKWASRFRRTGNSSVSVQQMEEAFKSPSPNFFSILVWPPTAPAEKAMYRPRYQTSSLSCFLLHCYVGIFLSLLAFLENNKSACRMARSFAPTNGWFATYLHTVWASIAHLTGPLWGVSAETCRGVCQARSKQIQHFS